MRPEKPSGFGTEVIELCARINDLKQVSQLLVFSKRSRSSRSRIQMFMDRTRRRWISSSWFQRQLHGRLGSLARITMSSRFSFNAASSSLNSTSGVLSFSLAPSSSCHQRPYRPSFRRHPTSSSQPRRRRRPSLSPSWDSEGIDTRSNRLFDYPSESDDGGRKGRPGFSISIIFVWKIRVRAQ